MPKVKKHCNEYEYVIYDWAGNLKFNGKRFATFEDAEEFLSEYFDKNGMEYEEWRDEYFIQSI